MDPSPAIESKIRERAARLARFNDRIVRCHVVVDMPHRHQRKGRQLEVRIDLTTPTGELVVTRSPEENAAHTDFNAVMRDAFDAITRQIEDDLDRRRDR